MNSTDLFDETMRLYLKYKDTNTNQKPKWLIPAIAGAGMVKVLAYILSAAGLIAADSAE